MLTEAAPAWAHGVGGRSDLPLPLWMVTYGATAALVISFGALSRLWTTPRLEQAATGVEIPAGRSLLRVALVVARVLGVVTFLVVWAAAAFGADDPSANLAPSAVYVVFWVGFTVASAVVGNVWLAFSPWAALSGLRSRVAGGRLAGSRVADRDGSPYRWGHWPAAAGLTAFAWLELAHPDPSSPRVLAFALGVYALAMVAGVARFGRAWAEQGDPFAAWFGLVAAMSPLHRGEGGRLRLRPPLAGLADLQVLPGSVALVLVALGSTSFDGLTRTSLWEGLLGRSSGWAATLLATIGLALCVGLVAVLYIGTQRLAARVVQRDPADLVRAFLPSLVPIAFAYAVAHYFSLLVFEGQTAWALASDPMGRGWDLFGTAARRVDYRVVSTSTIAVVQAGAIVIGHVAGVMLAHDRAVALFRPGLAVRSQYPLLAAMVAYTISGLLLLLSG